MSMGLSPHDRRCSLGQELLFKDGRGTLEDVGEDDSVDGCAKTTDDRVRVRRPDKWPAIKTGSSGPFAGCQLSCPQK